jgi:hypothetical protein
MPTGRLIVGRDAPAQANSQDSVFINFRVVNLGRPDLGLCLLLDCLSLTFIPNHEAPNPKT